MMEKSGWSPPGLFSCLATNASMIRSTTVSKCLHLLSFERDQCFRGQGIGKGIQPCIFEHTVEISKGCSHNPQCTCTDRRFPCQCNIHTLLIFSGVELAAKTISVKGDECRTQPFRRGIPGTFLLDYYVGSLSPSDVIQ